jgi:hypothetical protein
MNGPRIAIAGLVAGIILLASGVILGHGILGPEYVRAFAAHRASPAGFAVIAKNTGIRLGLGFALVFLYAAMRPRFGPGPRTAVVAALTLWLVGYLPYFLTLGDFGILTGWRFPVSIAWTLGEVLLGAMAGGWLYREKAPDPGSDGAARATGSPGS